MPFSYAKLAVCAALLLSLLSLSPAWAAQRRSSRKQAAKQEPPPAQPLPPPPPLTPEQLPASAPHVTFKNGLLTIVAQNSTLGDILRAVRTQTGAAVEVPPNATERVVSSLGPGPPRDVLASLLNGSHFNYVMLGSAINPDRVERIILTSKAGAEPNTGSPGSSNAGNRLSPAPQGEIPPVEEQEEETIQGQDAAEQPAENEQEETSEAADDQQSQPNGQPAVKTPEQLLRELQQQQQQLLQPQQQPQQPPQGFPTPPNRGAQGQPPQ